MATAKCGKSCPAFMQKSCRVCSTLVCFTCVLNKIASWDRQTLKKTPNWWCDNCSKGNKENVTPNVAQEKEENEKCKGCGNKQPVPRICELCEYASLCFCVRDDCWKIDTTRSSVKMPGWMCFRCLRTSYSYGRSCGKYTVPIFMDGKDGTARPELFFDEPSADETSHKGFPSLDLNEWHVVDDPVDRSEITADKILPMRMEDVVKLVNRMKENGFTDVHATRQSTSAKSKEEIAEEEKEVQNRIRAENVDHILKNMKEGNFQYSTLLESEKSEAESSNTSMDDDDEAEAGRKS